MTGERTSKRVGDIMPEVLKNLGLADKIEEIRLRDEWHAVVGDVVASRSRPLEVRGRTLFVEVENNVWMQEIRFHQSRIIARIKKRFPHLGIDGIRLVIERERSKG